MESLTDRFRNSEALAKLIGATPVFLSVIEQIPAAARSEAAVLISGETGTGKELVARAIHYLSERAGYPFVSINCGSFTDTLLEDELFGHQRGAFTGAHMCREGLIAQAHRGTLFLDEVDTLPIKAQVDLLRVLQDKKFRPVGSALEQRADLRVVAATNASMVERLQAGSFRRDLYYRLCVFSIHLPPLRDRQEDILALSAHFLEKHAPANRRKLKLTPEASGALLAWNWPGNVRELENAIIRAIHLCPTDLIGIADLGLQSDTERRTAVASGDTTKACSFSSEKRKVIEAFEKDYLTRLMSEHRGNVTHAARAAGKERRDLGKLLKKHGLEPKLFRCPAAVPLDNLA